MIPKTETSEDDAAKRSIPVNREETLPSRQNGEENWLDKSRTAK